MRSIRLWLSACCLGLLALGLGTVSILAYTTTKNALHDKQQTTEKLLQTQYEELCHKEHDKLDDALLSQARTLAGLAQLQFQMQGTRRGRDNHQAPYRLGLVLTTLTPTGPLLAAAWTDSKCGGALAERLYRLNSTDIQINEDLLNTNRRPANYSQINTEKGRFWRSRSMGDHKFPCDPELFQSLTLFDWKFEDSISPSGAAARRILFKAPVVHFRRGPLPSMPPWANRSADRSQPFSSQSSASFPPPRKKNHKRDDRPFPPGRQGPPDRFAERSSPSLLIQCMYETSERDAALQALARNLDDDLRQLHDQARDARDGLQNRLLLIGLITFVISMCGGYGLVRYGLAPLQHLSEAVSQVSAKDFRLPFHEPRLPTELRPIVERLQQTLNLLQRAFDREKQAAADISHELRTPLAALLTTIEVALHKPRTPDEYREMLQDCRASGQQMSQLVEQLLALAHLDASADVLRPQEINAAALAEQCLSLVRPLAEARGLKLRFHGNGPILLRADPDKLREILTNLLHNAIEYNRPEGSVDLALSRHNGHLRVEVRDTGIGITPEACTHIFERFYRVDSARRAEGLHAGLGLAIVKGYIDLMSGTIDVKSVPGQGSTFYVCLPAH